MHQHIVVGAAGLLVAGLALAPAAQAARFSYVTLDIAGHTRTQASAQPGALNDSDQVVGSTSAGSGAAAATEGFLWQNGSFTLYPQATALAAINDGGVAAGDPAGAPAGATGYLTIATRTGATHLYADGFAGTLTDINAAAAVTGYQTTDQVTSGYLLRKGAVTAILVPGSDVKNGGTTATAINAGSTVAGYYSEGAMNNGGFIYAGGTYTTFSPPDAANVSTGFITGAGIVGGSFTSTITYGPVGFTWQPDCGGANCYSYYLPPDGFVSEVTGIGPGGEVAGSYVDNQIKGHGFVVVNGQYYPINVPGGSNTRITGINARGTLIGSYTDAAGAQRTFVARCARNEVCTQ